MTLARTSDLRYGPADEIVVVGGRAAGWAATAELRRLGSGGRLTVIGAEDLGAPRPCDHRTAPVAAPRAGPRLSHGAQLRA